MEMLHQSLEKTVENYCPTHAIHDDWNMDGLRNYFLNFLTTEEDFRYTNDELGELEPKDLVDFLEKRAIKMYEMKEKLITPERMRELERVVLLKTVDRYWMDHIDNMSELKQGIYLRGYGQKDPVTEYKIEGFDMFDAMVEQIREDTVRILMTIRIRTEQEVKREQVAKPTMATHGGEGGKKVVRKAPVRVQKVGRNDPCPCGSGQEVQKVLRRSRRSDPTPQLIREGTDVSATGGKNHVGFELLYAG